MRNARKHDYFRQQKSEAESYCYEADRLGMIKLNRIKCKTEEAITISHGN